VIDLDDLSKVYPHPRHSFALENLQLIWPNYAAIPQLKVVIPTVIADEQEREQLRAATLGARFLVCELTAPQSVLKDRVTAREPNGFWRTRLARVCRSVLSANRLAPDQRLPGEDIRLLSGRGSA
jgi:hypothetical protein